MSHFGNTTRIGAILQERPCDSLFAVKVKCFSVALDVHCLLDSSQISCFYFQVVFYISNIVFHFSYLLNKYMYLFFFRFVFFPLGVQAISTSVILFCLLFNFTLLSGYFVLLFLSFFFVFASYF